MKSRITNTSEANIIYLFSPLFPLLLCLIQIFTVLPASAEESGASANSYIGSASCQSCHESQYASFINHARHSRSFESVQKMKKGLTQEEIEECYSCHTMGYGQPGGFTSLEETPELKNVGCEICHGQGKLHAETGNPAQISTNITIEICNQCHIEERIKAFRYKPIIFAGSH